MNPILVEAIRGSFIESVHRGSVAIADAEGRIVASVGNVVRPVFPRSAIKALQAIPFVETGTWQTYGFTAADLALACASHSGWPMHSERAEAMLTRAGSTPEALSCAAHWPMSQDVLIELARAGQVPTRCHNNCSGKHAAMVATAIATGAPVAGYASPDHPVQGAVRTVLSEMTGGDLSTVTPGIDGCGLPNWPIPLVGLAKAFAKFAPQADVPVARRDAIARILQACWAHPDLTAGPGRLDTEILENAAGAVYLKTGAEGVYCAALPERGLGIALKIDDGATRASEIAIATLVAELHAGARDALAKRKPLQNWAGDSVGRLCATGGLLELAFGLERDRLKQNRFRDPI